jgi:hypothetical protein
MGDGLPIREAGEPEEECDGDHIAGRDAAAAVHRGG